MSSRNMYAMYSSGAFICISYFIPGDPLYALNVYICQYIRTSNIYVSVQDSKGYKLKMCILLYVCISGMLCLAIFSVCVW